MRLIAASLLVAVGCMAACQSQPPTITYRANATALQTVLYQISKQAGVQLQCSQDLAEEPIILRLNNVPTQQLMDKLAEVTAGEWVKRGKATELRRSPLADKIHQDFIQKRTEDIKKSVSDLVESCHVNEPYTKQMADRIVSTLQAQIQNPETEFPANDTDRPGQRLLAHWLNGIDLSKVAQLSIGRSLVFATDPTVLEMDLPDGDKLLDEYSANNKLVFDDVMALANRYRDEQKQDIINQVAHTDVDVAKAILKISARIDGQYPVVLFLFDAKDNICGGASATLGAPDKTNDPTIKFLTEKSKLDLPLSDRSKAAIAYSNRNSWLQDPTFEGKPIPEDLVREFLTPASNDPLSYVTSDLVLDIGDKDNVNVVFLPTDHCERYFYKHRNRRDAQMSLDVPRIVLAWPSEMQVSESDGWLVGQPLDPVRSLNSRTPRHPLEDLVGMVEHHGYATILDLGRFISQLPDDCDTGLAYLSLRRLTDQPPQSAPKSFYAFIDSLTPSQQSVVSSGGLHLESTELSDDQKAFIVDCLQGDNVMLRPVSHAANAPYSSLDMEPSEVFGSGVAGARIEISGVSQPRYVINLGDRVSSQSLDGLAGAVALANNRPNFAKAFHFDSIRIGAHRDLTLLIIKKGRYEDFYAEFTASEETPSSDRTMTLQQILDGLSPSEKLAYQSALMKAAKEYQADSNADESSSPPSTPPSAHCR